MIKLEWELKPLPKFIRSMRLKGKLKGKKNETLDYLVQEFSVPISCDQLEAIIIELE